MFGGCERMKPKQIIIRNNKFIQKTIDDAIVKVNKQKEGSKKIDEKDEDYKDYISNIKVTSEVQPE